MSLRDSGQYYHEVLKRIPPRALPAFEDEAMLERVWGRRWGVLNDVGTLRTVLVHRPGDEIRIMTADRYDPSIEALIDDDAQWYWRGDRARPVHASRRHRRRGGGEPGVGLSVRAVSPAVLPGVRLRLLPVGGLSRRTWLAARRSSRSRTPGEAPAGSF